MERSEMTGKGEEWVGTHSARLFERFYEERIKYLKSNCSCKERPWGADSVRRGKNEESD